MHHCQVSLGGDGVVFGMLKVWCERRGENMIITPHGKDRDLGQIMVQIHFISTCCQPIGGNTIPISSIIWRGNRRGVFFFLNSVFIIIFLIEKYKYKGPAALHGWIMEFL